MKLFRKTLLFFIGVIVFQSALTLALISTVTRRANLADARRELAEEAVVLYDGLNAWKRQVWKSLIELAANGGGDGGDGSHAGRGASLSAALARRDPASLDRALRERLLAAKVEAIVLKSPRGPVAGRGAHVAGLVQTAPGSLTLSDVQALANTKPHPYIELLEVRGGLCLVGVTELGGRGSGGPRADVFLLKRLDGEFCAQLTLNRRSRVAFLQGSAVLAGSLPPAGRLPFFDPGAMRSAYMERFDQRVGGEGFNAAFQRLGRLAQRQEGEELFLGTFLSNEPYDAKLLLLDRTILAVSLAGALLTLALSLFLSRAITHPIADLFAGMERIRDGAWDTRVHARGGYEINRLFLAFNEMARELHDHIRETVLLKEYNEKIIHSIRAGIAIVDRDLVVEKANSSFLESFGLDGARVVGAPLTLLDLDLVDAVLVERILSILRRERESWSEVKRSRGGRVYEIRLYPFYYPGGGRQEVSGCVLMADDISAKTELEEKIFQAEKLSSISMLSAGMAHEINNPLGSILTNVQNLIDEEECPEKRIALKWIEQETRRIARIVAELLNFASADSGHASGADVNRVVEEVIGLVSHPLEREGRVRIDTRLAAGLPPAVVSPDELKQVVLNLLKNSLQAIRGAGRILVSTRPGDPGGRIMLAVADTGTGIPPEVLPRIFDPFFTTKANGEGTGLGLSVVYGIVTKYNGTIDVRSRPGRGTRIRLGLPGLREAAGGGA